MARSLMMIWFFLSILSIKCGYTASSQLATALYVFGDSTVDAGNNNNLQTKAKANYLPYGIDFNNTPTGRFTNGMMSADIIAKFLGLPYPPAYMNLPEAQRSSIITGLNYGSGSCGILPTTGSIVGACLSFDKQIGLFENTTKNSVAKQNLGKSIIYISIGANDYTLGYLQNNSKTMKPEDYAKFITDEFVNRLKTLYQLGARKFLVNGLGPIGCIPIIRHSMHSDKCVDLVNFNAKLFNDQLSSKLKMLQSQLPNSFFTYSDYFNSFQRILDLPASYGITNVMDGCWNQDTKSVCPMRNKYLFFDDAHITEFAQNIITALCFSHSTMCTPLNILQLASA